jgi:eukaryotic-like serine/threonine-protein kinase
MPEGAQAGRVLGGKFRLARDLASDPLLEVWLADDLELQREVIVKLLHPRWLDDAGMVERFRFEALAAARLDHENIARTYDVEDADGALFTVSEYIPGPTVAELWSEGPYPPRVVGALGQQCALGLAAAHAEGLVHRAICPENLVLTSNGRLCIVDFGSVRALDSSDDDRLPDPVFPEPGVRVYWPPERHDGGPVDDRGDVYSLGLVLWEGLTGSAEVDDDPGPGVARRLLAGLTGGDPSERDLRELLTWATATGHDDRPSAIELADALADLYGVRPRDHLDGLVAAFESDR